MSDSPAPLPPVSPQPLWARPVAGLLLLLAVLFPFKFARAAQEVSFWLDDTWTIVVASQTVAKVIEHSAVDSHPPGYTLAVKAWLKLGRILGGEPGVLWARMLNTGVWAMLSVLTWFGARRLLGSHGGALATWAVAAGAACAQIAKELRSYGWCIPATFLCLLAVLCAACDESEGPRARRVQGVLWTLYVVFAEMAMWGHLLSCIHLFSIGLVWVFLAARRPWRSPFVVYGLMANVLAVLLFLPWLRLLPHQMAFWESAATWWMTPATPRNFLLVFAFFFPSVNFGHPAYWPISPPMLAMGVGTFLLPLGALVLARVRRPANPAMAGEEGRLALIVIASLFTAVFFVFVTWMLAALGITATFHGPRYQLFGALPWGFGLATAAWWASRRFGWGGLRALLLMVPWFVSGTIGQLWSHHHERDDGMGAHLAEIADLMPPKGGVIYMMPSELIPFYRQSLKDWDVRRIEDLWDNPPDGRDALVLQSCFWEKVWMLRDHVVDRTLKHDIGGERVVRGFPKSGPCYKAVKIPALDAAKLRAVAPRAFLPIAKPFPADALSTAKPEDQASLDGWSFPEVTTGLDTVRWGAVNPTLIRFTGDLPVGKNTLVVKLHRQPYPEDVVEMQFELLGTGQIFKARTPKGTQELRFPVSLDAPLRSPVVAMHHPVWRPALVKPEWKGDGRSLTAFFMHAWFEPAGGGRP